MSLFLTQTQRTILISKKRFQLSDMTLFIGQNTFQYIPAGDIPLLVKLLDPLPKILSGVVFDLQVCLYHIYTLFRYLYTVWLGGGHTTQRNNPLPQFIGVVHFGKTQLLEKLFDGLGVGTLI